MDFMKTKLQTVINNYELDCDKQCQAWYLRDYLNKGKMGIELLKDLSYNVTSPTGYDSIDFALDVASFSKTRLPLLKAAKDYVNNNTDLCDHTTLALRLWNNNISYANVGEHLIRTKTITKQQWLDDTVMFKVEQCHYPILKLSLYQYTSKGLKYLNTLNFNATKHLYSSKYTMFLDRESSPSTTNTLATLKTSDKYVDQRINDIDSHNVAIMLIAFARYGNQHFDEPNLAVLPWKELANSNASSSSVYINRMKKLSFDENYWSKLLFDTFSHLSLQHGSYDDAIHMLSSPFDYTTSWNMPEDAQTVKIWDEPKQIFAITSRYNWSYNFYNIARSLYYALYGSFSLDKMNAAQREEVETYTRAVLNYNEFVGHNFKFIVAYYNGAPTKLKAILDKMLTNKKTHFRNILASQMAFHSKAKVSTPRWQTLQNDFSQALSWNNNPHALAGINEYTFKRLVQNRLLHRFEFKDKIAYVLQCDKNDASDTWHQQIATRGSGYIIDQGTLSQLHIDSYEDNKYDTNTPWMDALSGFYKRSVNNKYSHRSGDTPLLDKENVKLIVNILQANKADYSDIASQVMDIITRGDFTKSLSLMNLNANLDGWRNWHVLSQLCNSNLTGDIEQSWALINQWMSAKHGKHWQQILDSYDLTMPQDNQRVLIRLVNIDYRDLTVLTDANKIATDIANGLTLLSARLGSHPTVQNLKKEFNSIAKVPVNILHGKVSSPSLFSKAKLQDYHDDALHLLERIRPLIDHSLNNPVSLFNSPVDNAINLLVNSEKLSEEQMTSLTSLHLINTDLTSHIDIVNDWLLQNSFSQYLIDPKAKLTSQYSHMQSVLDYFENNDNASFKLLTSANHLINEGQGQAHCVGNYIKQVRNGECVIITWHDTVLFADEKNKHVTVELQWDYNKWVISQIKGYRNRNYERDYYKDLLADLVKGINGHGAQLAM